MYNEFSELAEKYHQSRLAGDYEEATRCLALMYSKSYCDELLLVTLLVTSGYSDKMAKADISRYVRADKELIEAYKKRS